MQFKFVIIIIVVLIIQQGITQPEDWVIVSPADTCTAACNEEECTGFYMISLSDSQMETLVTTYIAGGVSCQAYAPSSSGPEVAWNETLMEYICYVPSEGVTSGEACNNAPPVVEDGTTYSICCCGSNCAIPTTTTITTTTTTTTTTRTTTTTTTRTTTTGSGSSSSTTTTTSGNSDDDDTFSNGDDDDDASPYTDWIAIASTGTYTTCNVICETYDSTCHGDLMLYLTDGDIEGLVSNPAIIGGSICTSYETGDYPPTAVWDTDSSSYICYIPSYSLDASEICSADSASDITGTYTICCCGDNCPITQSHMKFYYIWTDWIIAKLDNDDASCIDVCDVYGDSCNGKAMLALTDNDINALISYPQFMNASCLSYGSSDLDPPFIERIADGGGDISYGKCYVPSESATADEMCGRPYGTHRGSPAFLCCCGTNCQIPSTPSISTTTVTAPICDSGTCGWTFAPRGKRCGPDCYNGAGCNLDALLLLNTTDNINAVIASLGYDCSDQIIIDDNPGCVSSWIPHATGGYAKCIGCGGGEDTLSLEEDTNCPGNHSTAEDDDNDPYGFHDFYTICCCGTCCVNDNCAEGGIIIPPTTTTLPPPPPPPYHHWVLAIDQTCNSACVAAFGAGTQCLAKPISYISSEEAITNLAGWFGLTCPIINDIPIVMVTEGRGCGYSTTDNTGACSLVWESSEVPVYLVCCCGSSDECPLPDGAGPPTGGGGGGGAGGGGGGGGGGGSGGASLDDDVDTSSSSGLSSAAIGGIVGGCIGGLAAIVLIGYFIVKSKSIGVKSKPATKDYVLLTLDKL